MDTSHSVLSPSAAGRWVHCPGSVSLEAAYPSQDSSHNLEGEACHEAAAHWLNGAFFPAVGHVSPSGVTITEEMLDAAKLYVDDVLDTVPAGESLHIEQPVTVAPIHPSCYGTPDNWAYDSLHSILYVWDLKYGFGIVEPEDNWQLITYAAGIIHEYKLPESTMQVCLRIVQPRGYHASGTVREWRVPATELRPYINKLYHSAHLALEPAGRDTMHSGQHCRYCSGRHACPALKASAYVAVDISHCLEIEEASSEALGREYKLLQEAADRIAYRLTGVEAQVRARTLAGDAETGYRLESALGRSSWDRPAAEVVMLGDLLGLDLRKPVETVTPTQAAKAGLDADVLSQYSSKKPTAAKLVPADKTLASQAFRKEQ